MLGRRILESLERRAYLGALLKKECGPLLGAAGRVRYRFELRPELFVTIKREGESLMSEAAGQRNELFANDGAKSELLTKEFDGRGKFVRNEQGRISHLIYYEFGREMGLAKKIC